MSERGRCCSAGRRATRPDLRRLRELFGRRATEGGTLYYLGASAAPQLIIANVIIPVEGNRPAVVNLSGWAIRGGVRFRF